MDVTGCLVAAVLAATLAACGEDPLVCVELDPTCAPLYPPTWDNVFDNTVHPKCGTGGSGCHEGVGARAGLRLDDRDLAYVNLTTRKDYVLVDDPGCSQLLERVYTTSSSLRMPRGSRLSDAERCALSRWVLAGAPGPIDAAVPVDGPDPDAGPRDAGVDATVSP
jgi:hypothetical protein